MGHVISYRNYPENVDRKRVYDELDDFVAGEDWQEGCSGLNSPIRWLDTEPFEDYDAAVDYIRKNDRLAYDNLAVRYKEGKPDKDLNDRMNAAYKKWQDLDSAVHYKDAKADFVSCKLCGSKLNRKRLIGLPRPNICPVCGHDLRPDSALKQISAAKSAYEKARDKAKRSGKGEIRWLVKFEYHE